MGNDKLRPKPSTYLYDKNEIWVNPYCNHKSRRAFFIPLTHEVFHWLIYRLFSWSTKHWEFHEKLEQIHMWVFINHKLEYLKKMLSLRVEFDYRKTKKRRICKKKR